MSAFLGWAHALLYALLAMVLVAEQWNHQRHEPPQNTTTAAKDAED